MPLNVFYTRDTTVEVSSFLPASSSSSWMEASPKTASTSQPKIKVKGAKILKTQYFPASYHNQREIDPWKEGREITQKMHVRGLVSRKNRKHDFCSEQNSGSTDKFLVNDKRIWVKVMDKRKWIRNVNKMKLSFFESSLFVVDHKACDVLQKGHRRISVFSDRLTQRGQYDWEQNSNKMTV